VELDNANSQLTQLNSMETGYIHSVFFWLKPDITVEEKQDFMENGLGELKKCKHLTSLFYGPPAMRPREIVDSNYDFARICHFLYTAGHEAYQIDPVHRAFVEKYEHFFGRVNIYDIRIELFQCIKKPKIQYWKRAISSVRRA